MTDPASRIPLPPIPTATLQESATSRLVLGILDNALVFFTLTLAFLVSSFAVRNADHWLHLASGRLLAHGQYEFGRDPFAAAPDAVRWINHSWLYDWLIYQLRDLGGGLVLLKAMFVTAMAWVMMQSARPAGRAPAAILTAIGIIAAGPRLLLQPFTVSIFFLTLVLFIIFRVREKSSWLLPLLCALWVNFDDWFILGPITIFLAGVGRWPWNRETRHLVFTSFVSLVACLLNPHHIQAIDWPTEIAPELLGSLLREDARIDRLFVSQWSWSRWIHTSGGLNPAGAAYLLLVCLGIISFMKNRQATRDGRLALWLGYAILGSLQARLVPFFAVVAAPITARNFTEIYSSIESLTDRSLSLRLRFRTLATILLILANVVAWPGWLHPSPYESRQVAWEIRPEPSLRLIAERLRRWVEDGRIPKDVPIFNCHPDVGPYLAWFGPPLRYTIDPRLKLFASASYAQSYVETYRWIMTDAPSQQGSRGVRNRTPALIIGYETTATRASDIFAGPLADPASHWRLLMIEGRATIFANGKSPGLDVESLIYDPKRKAFQESESFEYPGGIVPGKPGFWDLIFRRSTQRPVDLDTAIMHLRQFDESALRRQNGLDGDPRAAAVAQLPANVMMRFGNMVDAVIDLAFRMANFGLFVPAVDPGPPEYAYLAIRQARRATADDPNLGEAWLRLGQAYLSLRLRTQEGSWSRDLTLLDQIRHAQIAFALETALDLDPGSIVAHHMLANLYTERGYLDIAYQHRRREIELLRQAGSAAGESAEKFHQSIESSLNRLREMERQIQERENQFTVQMGNMGSRPLEQAQAAIRLGLAKKALDEILLRSDVRLFGINGAQLQLHLMLMLGRANQVRDFLNSPELAENPEQLDVVAVASHGGPGYLSEYRMLAYDWYRTVASAVLGDYDQAERSLRAIEQRTKIDADEEADKVRQRLAILLAAEIGAGYLPEIFIYRSRVMENRIAFEKLMLAMDLAQLLRADLLTVAGLLALERGNPDKCREHLLAALKLARSSNGDVRNFAGRAATQITLKRVSPTAGD